MSGRRGTRRRLAAAAGELAMPVPFDLGEFGARLQRGRARPLHLLPFTLAPDLFGAWIRTAAADYLYYEEQTSPFHQAHVAARLAASVLLGQEPGVPLGPGVLPAVGPELAEPILGPGARNPLTQLDTETFAFLALERSRGRHARPAATRRLRRQLRPLHAALRAAVPDAETSIGGGARAGGRLRLYRRVIEIRSAQLALGAYQDPLLPVTADAAGRAAGLARDELAATVEATVITAALHAQQTGAAARRVTVDVSWAHRPKPDLSSEARWLARVSRAFAGSPLVHELARNGRFEDPPKWRRTVCHWGTPAPPLRIPKTTPIRMIRPTAAHKMRASCAGEVAAGGCQPCGEEV